jgi:hypothetical protein
MPPRDIPEVGKFTLIQDLQGGILNLVHIQIRSLC